MNKKENSGDLFVFMIHDLDGIRVLYFWKGKIKLRFFEEGKTIWQKSWPSLKAVYLASYARFLVHGF